MINASYIKTTTIREETEVMPLLMEIFKLRYEEEKSSHRELFHFNQQSIKSLKSIKDAARVLFPFCNLEQSCKDEFLKQIEDLIEQLKSIEEITITVKKN